MTAGLVLLGASLATGGGVAIFVSWKRLRAHRRLARFGVRTTGEVAAIEETTFEGRPTYLAVIRFRTDEGAYHFYRTGSSSGEDRRVGQQVPMVFDSAAPENGQPDSILSLWVAPILLGVLELTLAGLGGYVALVP